MFNGRLFVFTVTTILYSHDYCTCQIVPPMPPAGFPMPPPANDPCMEAKNLSQTMNLPNHKYLVLENCLYYDLQRKSDFKTGQINSLAVMPPVEGRLADNVTIQVVSHTLQHLWLNDMMKDLRLRGVVVVNWYDPRLSWNIGEFKLMITNIQTAAHIWVPQINSDKFESSVANGDYVEFRRIKVYSNGTVTSLMNYNLQSFCDVDSQNFPHDTHTCCFRLRPTLYENIVDFKLTTFMENKIDTRFFRETGYRAEKIEFKTVYDDANGIAGLNCCLSIVRSNSTMQIEMAIPMALCAVLMLIAPLFGSMKTQLHVKLFTLLLQYLCLQFLANKLTYLGSGATPKIFKFYEFSIVMNLLSIILTLIISVSSRKERNLPPSQHVRNFCSLISKFFCCLDGKMDDTVEGKTSHKSDWNIVFGAFHVLLMFCLLISYIVGVLVIYS